MSAFQEHLPKLQKASGDVVSMMAKQHEAVAREFARLVVEHGAMAAAEYVERWTEQRARLRRPKVDEVTE